MDNQTLRDPFSPENFPGIRTKSPAPDFLNESFPKVAAVRVAAGQSKSFCMTCAVGKVEAPGGPFRLPDPGKVKTLGSVEVWTLRYGDAWYLSELGATLDEWTRRHGYRLRVHNGEGYENLRQFAKVDMLRHFLRGDADWFLYVDSDCYVHPSAPPIFEAVTESGLWALIDLESTARKWPSWLAQYGLPAFPEHSYRNTGVLAVDRATARRLVEFTRGQFRKGYLEQHQFNVWFAESGITMRELPDRWNSFRERHAPAWLFHFAGHRKDKRLRELRERGRLPDVVKRFSASLPPDFGKGAVVWPWKSSDNEWGELEYSVRSVQKFWSEKNWPLVMFGDKRPDWWPGEFVHAPSYEQAVWQGVQCAEKVLWMNDDIFMLAPQSPDTFARAREFGDMANRLGETLVAQNTWRRGLGQVLMRLHHLGKPVRNFSTHTPYLFERDKAREVLDIFGAFHKIPFETAYHNWHRTPWSACTEKAGSPQSMDGKLWINPKFAQITPEFIQSLDARMRLP